MADIVWAADPRGKNGNFCKGPVTRRSPWNERTKKSFDELRVKMIRDEGAMRLYLTIYLVSARGGAFFPKAIKITG